MNAHKVIELARRQSGIIARRQLRALGVSRNVVRSQTRARRWMLRSQRVISTFTGELTFQQKCWLGVLHAGQGAIVGELTAATLHGLQRWQRPDISVLLPTEARIPPLSGIRWIRTRRSLSTLRDPNSELPVAQIVPAVLMFGASDHSPRTAMGAVAAVIQQRLATPQQFLDWLNRLPSLHRAAELRDCIRHFADGVDSVGELDVAAMCNRYRLPHPVRQTPRRGDSGRWRYLDCEWRLPSGHSVCLEVDGAFHMEVAHWQSDIARARDLASPSRTTIRCTTWELKTEVETVARALVRLGVRSVRAAA